MFAQAITFACAEMKFAARGALTRAGGGPVVPGGARSPVGAAQFATQIREKRGDDRWDVAV
ncbi:hypothetical protein GCM10011393_10320 [Sphingopyxis bauzanensis]|nr:hypothetical protein GCM10011393_10320 [Sphingopyxis bauzanensis]